MLSSQYQAKQAIAMLISREGTSITLRKVTTGSYNPATGTTTDTTSDITLSAMVRDTMSNESQDALDRRDKIEGVITSYNSAVLIQHTEAPTKAWKVLIDYKEYEIVFIHYRRFADSYELALKK